MLPYNFDIKNYSLPSQTKTQSRCYVCEDILKTGVHCASCGQICCMNKCMVQILPEDVKSKPWMADKLMKRICLKCMPNNATASENYIRKVFAQLFASDEDIIDENENKIETSSPIGTSSQSEKMDQLIGGILKDFAYHNILEFDNEGNLTPKTIGNLTNRLKTELLIAANTI